MTMFCNTTLFTGITPNTTIWQALTPCLSLVGASAVVDALLAPGCALILLLRALFFGGSAAPRKLHTNALVYTKTAITVAFGALAVAQVVIGYAWLDERAVEFRVNGVSNLVFAIFALISYRICVEVGIVSCGALHLAWMGKFVALIPSTSFVVHEYFAGQSTYFQCSGVVFTTIVWISLLYLAGCTAMVGLLCHADRGAPSQYVMLVEDADDTVTREVCPEANCSAISAFFLWYASPLIRKGLSTTLDYDQLWALEQSDRASFLREKFAATGVGYSGEARSRLLIFFWRMLKATWAPLFSVMVMVFIIVGIKFANSILLREIVNSVQDAHPLWYSLLALMVLYVFGLAQNIISAKRDYLSFVCYLNLRSILIMEIFMKMLRLSASSRAKYSTGEVMNIITTDVQRFRMFWFQLRDFVYCPLMITVSIFGLFFLIGWNTMYGIVIMLIVLPVNYVITSKMSYYEQYQMKVKDSRLKLVNDMLSGMKVLRLYAWEIPMQKMVAALREKELAALRRIFLLDGVITVSFQFGPALALFASFYGYTVVDGNRLRPDVAFVALMFFMMLRYALCQLPNIIANSIKALVSGARILRFLNEDEQQMPNHIQRRAPDSDVVVLLDKCTYTWGTGINETKAAAKDDPAKTTAANGGGASNGAAGGGETSSRSVAPPPLHLSDVRLSVKRGELIGVVGRVGSGKSSLVAAILGEMDCVESERAAVFARRIGYVPQQPWIQNKTLRDNILFEKRFDESLYRRTIHACSLTDDLKLLSAGDMTEIGEKGINLSGGQRARVSLARAVYQQADLYILDDVLSAVDSHVGAHIFEKVIGPSGLLKNTTRIFALNSLAFLKHCDRIVVMHEGKVHEIGTFTGLLAESERNGGVGPFADLMREYLEKQAVEAEKTRLKREEQGALNADGEEEVGDEEEAGDLLDVLPFSPVTETFISEKLSPPTDSFTMPGSHLSSSVMSSFVFQRQVSRLSQPHTSPRLSVDSGSVGANSRPDSAAANATATATNAENGRLTDEEELGTGVVARTVYLNYVKAFGLWTSFLFLSTLLLGSVLEAMSNVWLARWSSQSIMPPTNATMPPIVNLGIYGLLGVGNSVLTGISMLCMAFGAYAASIRFHDGLVHSLLRAPMAFFDRTPLGRIMNRLSADIDRIDESIPFCLSYTFFVVAAAVNSIIAILMVIPALIVLVVPVFAIFMIIMYYFTKASVQFRRLTSKALSRCFAFVQDSYSGGDSLRAYEAVETAGGKVGKIIDCQYECTMTEVISNRWIQIRLDILTNTTIFVFVLVAIILGDQNLLSIGSLALVINSGISFSGFLGEIARMCREVEVQIVGVERVQEYMNIDSEAEWRGGERAVAPNWPAKGEIVFDDLQFRYRPDAELVLRDLCLRVPGGTKVGIVGRTGAGKSSITLALFRIVEPFSGRILIDGVDITKVGLHDLRQVLTIIPQEPVLFCGTLRTNLDPFEEFEDAALWSAIEKANLKTFVADLEKGLQHEISEGGNNLSVGQRQLVCLARALLRSRSARILILDEATAAIDPETDRLIQLCIRQDFQNCTILTIAHRLNTVLDYDRILVMEAGRVAEYDTPHALLANAGSMFASLCRHAGISPDRQQRDHAD